MKREDYISDEAVIKRANDAVRITDIFNMERKNLNQIIE